jgi:hypothetical protein
LFAIVRRNSNFGDFPRRLMQSFHGYGFRRKAAAFSDVKPATVPI